MKLNFPIFVLVFFILSVCQNISAFADQKCPKDRANTVLLKKVADGIYAREGVHEAMTKNNLAGIANVGFIIGKRTIVVVDSGGSYCDAQLLKKALRKISNLPISHVINTHSHPDHVFGNAAFKEKGVDFVGHYKLKRAMQERGSLYLENLKRLMGEDALVGVEIITPTQLVKSQTKIDLGERIVTLTAHNTAHTDHDLTVFDETTKTIWTGDLLFETRIPVLDGSILGWLKVIEELAKIKANHVIPGHGSLSLSWPKALTKQKQYLTNLANDLRKVIAEGGTMLDAQKHAGKSEKKNWKLFDEFNARNASTAFAELEWEE